LIFDLLSGKILSRIKLERKVVRQLTH